MELWGIAVDTGEGNRRDYHTGARGDCVWAGRNAISLPLLPLLLPALTPAEWPFPEVSSLTVSKTETVGRGLQNLRDRGTGHGKPTNPWSGQQGSSRKASARMYLGLSICQQSPSFQPCVHCFRKPNKSGDLITWNYLIRELFILQIITLINQGE